jgi:hypothetical protein
MRTIALILALTLCGCARVEEKLNQVQRSWDASPKTVTLYSQTGQVVKTYDIGRSKVTRAENGGDYIYFYDHANHYVQTNLPYVVESH